MPYRQRDIEERGETQTGIVGDLVRQFADPYAFFRELVQNAIDAGSTSIRVQIERDAEGALLIAVRDRGEGMDRQVLEEKLLVLFRSGKEGQSGKIGKFGIGFVSVLAIDPSVVKVRTSRAGVGHTLHLYRDHSYELFEHGGAASGTDVTLVIPSASGTKGEQQARRHVERSRESLRQWCEHAQIPIELVVHESAGGRSEVERIDRPLGLEAGICEVVAKAPRHGTVVVVALSLRESQEIRFYNRGLLLLQTQEDLGFPGLRLKVQDSELEHTLSRDNVRRDRSYERVMRFAREVVGGPLVEAVFEKLKASEGEARGEYQRVLRAYAHTRLPLRGLPLRLLHPLGETPAADAPTFHLASSGQRLRGARVASPLTRATARQGLPVIDLTPLTGPLERRLQSENVRLDETWLQHVTAIESVVVAPNSPDAQLLARVGEILAEVYREPRAVRFGVIRGEHKDAICVGDPGEVGRAKNPFSLLPFLRGPLVLNVGHPLVRRARQEASETPVLASDVLARAILVTVDALSERRSDALVERSLDAIVAGLPEAKPAKGTKEKRP